MLAQKRLFTSLKNKGKILIQYNLNKFSTSTQTPDQSINPVPENTNASGEEIPFKFHQDWQEQAQKKIQEQLNNLESELSEQQKKRVKLVSDAYLDLNINEVRYFNSLLRQRVERTSGIDLAQASSEWPAFKQNDASPAVTESRIKYEERMSKLWPMGQRAVSEMFSQLFGAAAGGVGGGFSGASAGGQAPAAEGGPVQAEAAAPVEKTHFDLELSAIDAAQKIKIIKEVRQLFGLGLKEAKEMVEKAPVTLKKEVKKDEAEDLKGKLEAAGCTVSLL